MTINPKELKALLLELYIVKPELKANETELLELIKRLAAAKPRAKFNDRTKAALKRQVLVEIGALSQSSVLTFNLQNSQHLTYALAGVLMFTVLLLVQANYYSTKTVIDSDWTASKLKHQNLRTVNVFSKTTLSASAFGALSNLNTQATTALSLSARGGSGESATMMRGNLSAVADSTRVADSSILPWSSVAYQVSYKGEPLALSQTEVEVLRRQKGLKYGGSLTDLLNGLNFGAINLGDFAKTELSSVNLVQRHDFGYIFNVSLDDGSVSLYQNWEYWPAGKCGADQTCYEKQQPKSEDMLTDQDAIALANEFVQAHNVDLSLYGEPQVRSNSPSIYQAKDTQTEKYIPETIEVVYPLKLDGKTIMDEWSDWDQGLQVSVHVKTKLISGVYGLSTQQYDSSKYQAETNFDRILQYAEKGVWFTDSSAKKIQVELGTPSQVWMRFYQYQGGRNEELLVPALLFPVTNQTQVKSGWTKNNILVPLVKEIIDERLNSSDNNIVTQPMFR